MDRRHPLELCIRFSTDDEPTSVRRRLAPRGRCRQRGTRAIRPW